MDLSIYEKTFELFCQSITNYGAKILEIACGPGNITRYLLKNREDFQILGIDIAPNMLELAKINNPKANFELMDCRNILSLNQQFDGIMCGFCLPYLSKEEAIELIENSYNLLNNNGIIYISTMEDDYSKSYLHTSNRGDQIFMHYHQADYLCDALEKVGFTDIQLSRQLFTDGKTIDLILIARKKIPS
jgi:2-polyprenyl-3-methyl-5-hydroxy-6-metoxy-1,4-benzoquinol methylase